MAAFDVDRLEDVLRAAVREEEVPAVALAVTGRDHTRYARGFGTTARTRRGVDCDSRATTAFSSSEDGAGEVVALTVWDQFRLERERG